MSALTVLGLASLGSIGAMAGAAGIAAAPARWRARLLPVLLAFSAGSMLAAAFLGMLPRAYRSLPPLVAGACVLGGLGLMLAIAAVFLTLARPRRKQAKQAEASGDATLEARRTADGWVIEI